MAPFSLFKRKLYTIFILFLELNYLNWENCAVLLDHGIYKEFDENFRLNYCQLWKALILLDSKKIQQIGEQFGVGKYSRYFPLIFTGRTINRWMFIFFPSPLLFFFLGKIEHISITRKSIYLKLTGVGNIRPLIIVVLTMGSSPCSVSSYTWTNGAAERKHQHIVEKGFSLLSRSCSVKILGCGLFYGRLSH